MDLSVWTRKTRCSAARRWWPGAPAPIEGGIMKSIAGKFGVPPPCRSHLAVVLSLFALVLVGCADDGTGNGADDSDQPTEPAGSILRPGPDGVTGRLTFSRFDESTHSFVSTHTPIQTVAMRSSCPCPGQKVADGGRGTESTSQS